MHPSVESRSLPRPWMPWPRPGAPVYLPLAALCVALCVSLALPGIASAQDSPAPSPDAAPPTHTAAQAAPASPRGQADRAERPGALRKKVGIGLILAGAASGGIGVYLTASNRDGDARNESKANVAFIASGLGLFIVGTLLYKSGQDAYRRSFLPHPAMRLTPVVAPDRVGLAWIGSF